MEEADCLIGKLPLQILRYNLGGSVPVHCKFEIHGQRATRAESGSAAMSLTDGDRERMKLVEEPRLLSLGIRGEGLAGELGHGFIRLAIVAGRGSE
jgi:hypothetical protein